MAQAPDPELQRRLDDLMREVEPSPPVPPERAKERQATPASRWPRPGVAVCVGMALTLLLGIQLGALPWRYRRELWQARGLAIGMVIGFAAGRLTARRPDHP